MKNPTAPQRDPIHAPVFVVGASRSGTELVRRVLNAHPVVNIAHETHYFDDLRSRFSPALIKAPSPAVRTAALAYFQKLSQSAYGLRGEPVAWNQTPSFADLDPAAQSLGPGLDAMFAAFCGAKPLTDPNAKVWGEKTPRHIFQAEAMLTAFPNARFVVVIRDPRAVAASYRDWHNRSVETIGPNDAFDRAIDAEHLRIRRSWSLTLCVLMWKSANATARRLVAQHGPLQVHLLRFEDLVTDPVTTIAALCGFLGIEPDAGMMDVPMVNSSFTAPGSQMGFKPEAAIHWQTVLSENEVRHVDRVAGKTLATLGYVGSGVKGSWHFSVKEWLWLGIAIPRAIFANRQRIGNLPAYVAARLRGISGGR